MKKNNTNEQQTDQKKRNRKAGTACAIVVLVAVIAIFAVLMNSGDGSTKEPATDSNGQTIATTQAPAKDTIALDKTIAMNGLSFTATEIQRNNGTTFVKPSEEGKAFVGVKFTVENTSSENRTVAYLSLFDSYADDMKCLLASTGQALFGTALNGELAPGKKMEGYHVIEVPANAKTLTLEFSALYRDGSNEKFVLDIPQ